MTTNENLKEIKELKQELKNVVILTKNELSEGSILRNKLLLELLKVDLKISTIERKLITTLKRG
jgi:HKD family nuclease